MVCKAGSGLPLSGDLLKLNALASRFGGVLFARDASERLVFANDTARRLYPFVAFEGRAATFDALFRATLVRGLNRDPAALRDPEGHLALLKRRQQAVQRYSFLKSYPGTRFLCMHTRTDAGLLAHLRIPVEALGIAPFLPRDDREIGIEEVLAIRDALEQARGAMDRLSVAIAILEPRGRVTWANGAFHDVLHAGQCLAVNDAGEVVAAAAGDRDAWADALRTARRGGPETVLALRGAADPIIVAVESAGGGAVAVRVAVGSPHPGVASVLQDLLGITPAQAAVVSELARGHSIKDIAEIRQAAPTTVSNQIKAAMRSGRQNRFAATRQSLLVRLALDVAAVTGRKANSCEET